MTSRQTPFTSIAGGKVDRTEEAGWFICNVDAEGHILGIEVLSASKVLAPGDWKKSGSADDQASQRRRVTGHAHGTLARTLSTIPIAGTRGFPNIRKTTL